MTGTDPAAPESLAEGGRRAAAGPAVPDSLAEGGRMSAMDPAPENLPETGLAKGGRRTAAGSAAPDSPSATGIPATGLAETGLAETGLAETGLAETGLAAMLDPVERGQLAEGAAWFAPRLVPGGRFRSRLKPDEDPRLLLICMTPRSGSTALSGLMLATGALGRGGERLNRNSAFLSRVIAATPPRSLRHLLEMVIRSSRGANGVAQIKADLPQLLPFLADPACLDLLRRAGIIYLTRENLLAQAISRYRGIQTGVWHAAAARAGLPAPEAPDVPYDHDAIAGQIDRIAGMMTAYERLFARLGLHPLRLTYEQVAAEPGAVMARIAALAGVDPAIAGQAASLDDGGFRRVSGGNNDALRDRFLAENRRHLVAGG